MGRRARGKGENSGKPDGLAGSLRAGALNTFSQNSAVTVASVRTLDLNGFSQTVPSRANAGLVNMGPSTAPGTVLTTTSYAGTGGVMAMKHVPGSRRLARRQIGHQRRLGRGSTAGAGDQCRWSGWETTGNGTQVVSAISGATTAPGAFMLSSGELRAGRFDTICSVVALTVPAQTTGSCAPTSSPQTLRSCHRLEAYRLCRLLQYFGAPLQRGALTSVKIWREGLHDAGRAQHARQGKGHIPHTLALRRQHGTGDQCPLVVLNRLRDFGKTCGATPNQVAPSFPRMMA